MADVLKHNSCIFKWKIKNFLSCHINYNKEIVSPTFEAIHFPVKNCEFRLLPDWCSVIPYDSIFIILKSKTLDKNSKSAFVNVKLEILNADGSDFISEEEKNYEMKLNGSWCRHFQMIKGLFQLLKSWDEDTLSIRFIMEDIQIVERDEAQCIEFEALTIVDVDRFVFKRNVSVTGCFDWSEKVPNSILPNFKITISTATDEMVEIKFEQLNKSSLKESVVYRLKFLSVCGATLASTCKRCISTDSLKFPKFISVKDLNIGNSWRPCYKYTFICECIVSKKGTTWSEIESCTSSSSVKKESGTPANSFPPSLQHDFRELFVSKKHSDVKLRVNGTDFLVHKAVLVSRSPVFSAMFNQDTLVNQSGVIRIEDMSEKTLQNLLEFMYTDVWCEMDFECALRLLLAADKYQISNLKDKCLSIILTLLSVENVCEVLAVADMINHEILKKHAQNYIIDNASVVLSASNWYLWVETNMRLATEIMCNLSKHFMCKKKD